jgi:hypothetical protein
LIYFEEARIVRILGRLRRIGRITTFGFLLRISFFVLLVLKVILFLCPVVALQFVPFASLGISAWRLRRRDYGDADGNIANIAKLAAALDIFYALVALLSVFTIYWMFLVGASDMLSVYTVASLTNKQRGYEKWISKVVEMYYKETRRKYNKDGELPANWNLITYSAGLLQPAASGDDNHLWGARVLDRLGDSKDIISVRQELLASRSSIQNLIVMICRRDADDGMEKRERAARIVAHLVNDLHITHFPDMLQCICSLLESCNQFCESQVACPSSSSKITLDEQKSLETSNVQHDDQTDHGQQVDGSLSFAGLAQRKQTFSFTR